MIEGPSIELEQNFAIGYSADLAVARQSLKLGAGNHFLLARNGRGKTTLLRTLAGALAKRGGDYVVSGKMQFVAEDIFYNHHLSARDVLKALIVKENWDTCFALAEKVELDVKKPYRALSTGNQRKISWLMAEFRCEKDGGNVLLLDEPFTGLDAYVREVFLEYWENHTEGVCRLISCHPDFDSMKIESSLLISEGEISQNDAAVMATWGEIKGKLR